MKRICFYHAGCPDGFGAAWAVWRAWGDEARYVPRGHDDRARAQEVAGAHVAFVDIAPGLDEVRALRDAAGKLVVLDHHITSVERFAEDDAMTQELRDAGHVVHFDLEQSGAVLAWRHFHPESEVPALLQYVQDQDLWNWELPRSQEVNALIGSHPREFAPWDALAQRSWEELAREGEPIVRALAMEVSRVVQTAAPICIGNERIEAVNATTQRANVGHELASRAAFGKEWGCVYRIVGSRVHATLYSIGEVDCAKVAQALGGGGHKNAAGFTVPVERWVRDFVL